MADLYRINVQLKYPYSLNPTGYYYCSAVHYALVDNLTQLDIAIDTVFQAEERAHNNAVDFDWQNIINLSTNTVFRNASITWPPFSWQSGDFAGLLNTVHVSFLAGGRKVSYKRVRAPLRAMDLEGDRLTPTARAFYESNYAGVLLSSGYACNGQGVLLENYEVRSEVSGWQLRHGTKRREVRRYHS